MTFTLFLIRHLCVYLTELQFNIIYLNMLMCLLFIYFWPHWVFVTMPGLSPFVVTRGYSVAVRGLLVAAASLVVEHGL